jgi:hypothetical protein
MRRLALNAPTNLSAISILASSGRYPGSHAVPGVSSLFSKDNLKK